MNTARRGKTNNLGEVYGEFLFTRRKLMGNRINPGEINSGFLLNMGAINRSFLINTARVFKGKSAVSMGIIVSSTGN